VHGMRPECEAHTVAGRQTPPSAERPFFFFHVPKVGGSTLRAQLSEDARRLQLPQLVPCFEGVKCGWWNEHQNISPSCAYGQGSHALACAYSEQTAGASIVAGHFGTTLVDAVHAQRQVLPEAGSQTACKASEPLTCVSCLVMLREPLDRLIAAYSYFDKRAMMTPFQQLSLTDMLGVVDQYGANVSLAYLGGGEYDPMDVATRAKQPPRGGSMQKALATLDHCSLGIMERWQESQALWRYELPWSSIGTNELHLKKSAKSTIKADELPQETQNVLRRAMSADVELYAEAVRRFSERFAKAAKASGISGRR